MDVTNRLLSDTYGPGDHVARVREAKPAKAPLPKTLQEELDRLRDPQTDRTMGFVARALAYSGQFRGKASKHTAVIRLIKGGFVRIIEHYGQPPVGTIARRDSPFGDRYYELEVVE